MAANPYTPPRAQVADVGTEEFQEARIFSISGRIGRLRYLAYTTVASIIIVFAVGIAVGIAGPMIGPEAIPLIILAAYVPIIIFSIMTMIQRSHDMDWSGWMCFLALIPLVGLLWIFKSGTQGENRYGAPPPPNPWSVKILAFAPFVLGVVLAAIAIPAYEEYVQRVQESQEQ